MAAQGFITLGEGGFNVDIYSGQDLSNFDTFAMTLKDPAGTTTTLTASRVDHDWTVGDPGYLPQNDGTACDIIRAAVVAADMATSAGQWFRQGKASGGSGVGPWYTLTEGFTVKAVLTT